MVRFTILFFAIALFLVGCVAIPTENEATGYAESMVEDDGWITASQVTDRPTLKQYVEDAKDYLEGITTLSEGARLRDVLRSEGQWKAESLYLTILTHNGYVVAHGDDPTAENKDIAAVRDEDGRPVVKELLDAAERGGDFVDYRWDDIETDSLRRPVDFGSEWEYGGVDRWLRARPLLGSGRNHPVAASAGDCRRGRGS